MNRLSTVEEMFPLTLPSVMWCQQNNVICYSAYCEGKWDEDKKRVVKDKFKSVPIKGRSGWSGDLIRKDYNLVMTQCGKPSGLLVIDLDIKDGKTLVELFGKELLEKLSADCQYAVETGSGGFHFYFRIPEGKQWTKMLKCETFAGFNTHGQLDILADGTGIVMEGSSYKHQGTLCEYIQRTEETTMDDITEMPDWLIDAVDECAKSTTPVAPNKITPSQVSFVETDDTSTPAPTSPPAPRSQSPNVKQALSELDLVASLVKGCLPPAFFVPYDNWFRFICCMKSINNTDACKEICVIACKTPKKYNNTDAEQKTRQTWDGLTPDGRMTMGTLRYWCRSNNEAKYEEILRRSYEILLLGSVNDVAQVFAQDVAGSIVFDPTSKEKEPNYWRYNEAQRLWTSIGQNALNYLFVETMPSICDRVRRAILARSNGDEALANKAKALTKLYSTISGGSSQKYTTPLQTVLNPVLSSSNFKDREFRLNDRPELLPLRNGVFNFKTGKLENYDRSHFVSYKIDIPYNKDADTSDIDKAMKMWYANDTEAISFIKYWLGYSMTGYIDRHEFVVVHGESGGNGKSLLFEEILGEDIFGEDLFISLSEDALSKKGGHNDSLYNARGKRLAVLSEAGRKGANNGFNVEAIKKWTGGGRYSVNAKFKNEITFIPCAKLVMLTQTPPELPADDGGIVRRYLCVKQNTPHLKRDEYMKYSEEDRKAGRVQMQDPEFVARLRANKEGWIKWLVEGAMSYMADPKRVAPASILDYSNKARAEGDKYSNWLHSNILLTGDPTDKIPMPDISREFIKNTGGSSHDTKVKGELISRISKLPRVSTSGKADKGRLAIHGVMWNVGGDPSLDEEGQVAQEEQYESWLNNRTPSSALAIEFLREQKA